MNKDNGCDKEPVGRSPPSGENAVEYLDMVKAELAGRPQVYNEFLHVMVLFRKGCIDPNTVVQRVYNLFEGNDRLVLNFQAFLPEGCSIDLSRDADGKCVPTVRWRDMLAPPEEVESKMKDGENELEEDSKMPAVVTSPKIAMEVAVALQEGLPNQPYDGASVLGKTSGQTEAEPTAENHPRNLRLAKRDLKDCDSSDHQEGEDKKDEDYVLDPQQEETDDEIEVDDDDSFLTPNGARAVAAGVKKVARNGKKVANAPKRRSPSPPPVPGNRLKHLVLSAPTESRKRHKELLFRLFAQYPADKLERLGKDTGAPLRPLELRPSVAKRRRQALCLSRLTKAMKELQAPEKPKSARRPTRPDYAARDRVTVEKETCAWHSAHQARPGTLTSFSLQFNECSLASISKWVARVGSKSPKKVEDLQSVYHQSVDAKFHLCHLCRLWGHYESECCNPRPEPFPHRLKGKRPRKGNFLNCEDDKYVLVVEDCEGQSIEQRAFPAQPLWSSDRQVAASQVPVATTEIDGSFITAMTSEGDHRL